MIICVMEYTGAKNNYIQKQYQIKRQLQKEQIFKHHPDGLNKNRKI